MSALALLTRALEETRAVEMLIAAGEWQRALERDAARGRLLSAALGEDGTVLTRPELRALTAEILQLNDRLIGMAEHRRRSVERDSDLLRLGRRAHAAYHQVGDTYPRG
jgi:hypothetical protein